jgi:hypothetical protein
LDLARKETADLLRKHGGKHSGKTGEELKAEAKSNNPLHNWNTDGFCFSGKS